MRSVTDQSRTSGGAVTSSDSRVRRPHKPHDEFIATWRRLLSAVGDGIGAPAVEHDVDDARRLVHVDARDVAALAEQAFTEEESQRQRPVGARRPHDHGKRLAVDAHLERRLDGDVIG